jgi:hypothetical protein
MSQLGFTFVAEAPTQEPAPFRVLPLEPFKPLDAQTAIPLYLAMIDRHHAAMLAGDEKTALTIRKDAHKLAAQMNEDGTTFGIIAGDDAPGCVLERETQAPAGTVPLWGQSGDFIIDVDGMHVRIEQDGIFGIGASSMPWPGFSAHIVDRDKPFLSDTGYRSFLGIHAPMVPNMTPDTVAREVIRGLIASEQKPARKNRKVKA